MQVGDRVLVRGLPSDDGKTFDAIGVIAMKRAAVDAKHKEQSDDWQESRDRGLVHTVDAAAGDVRVRRSDRRKQDHHSPYDEGHNAFAAMRPIR